MSDDSRPVVSDMANVIGVVDLDDEELDASTHVGAEYLKQAMDVLAALGANYGEVEVGFVATSGDMPPALAIRPEGSHQSSLLIAPRKKGGSE